MSQGVHLDTSDGRRLFIIDDDLCFRLDTSAHKENHKMIQIFLYAYVSLLSDSPLNPRRGFKPLRLYRSFIRSFDQKGLRTVIVEFAELADLLVSNLKIMGDVAPTGDFIDAFKMTPIFAEYLAWYRSADPAILKYIYTVLTFGKKLLYVAEDLNPIAFRDWEQVELRLSETCLPDQYLPWLRKIIDQLLAPADLSYPVFPKFGPGAVFEDGVRGVVLKANNLRYSKRMYRAFFRSYFVNFGLNAESGYSEATFFDGIRIQKRKHDEDCARLRFVPKTIKSARSICMETNTRMCFQQAYLKVLLRQMDNPVCRRFIRFEDQGRNRALAEYGSYTSEIDTIDLSAASDSVSLELVKKIFPPRELYFLLSTRSKYVDVGEFGPRREPKKFAPMGSALCFPTQSLVYTSVVVLAAIIDVFGEHQLTNGTFVPSDFNVKSFIEKRFSKTVGYIAPLLKVYQPAGVYGDDICVDRRLTPIVTRLLTELGFKVNTKKSFVGSQAFRESCGGYYWQGFDITPLYFRIPYFQKPDASVMVSAISLANVAGDRGLHNLRRYLIHALLSMYQHVRFTDSRDDTCAIYSTNVRNTHLPRRINSALQREEVCGLAVTAAKRKYPSKREVSSLEGYLYARWQASRISEIVPEDFSSAPRYASGGARLRGVWTPT